MISFWLNSALISPLQFASYTVPVYSRYSKEYNCFKYIGICSVFLNSLVIFGLTVDYLLFRPTLAIKVRQYFVSVIGGSFQDYLWVLSFNMYAKLPDIGKLCPLSRHTVEREEECLIFQLAHSAHLWNVRLLCTDGPLEQVFCWQCCGSGGSVCYWASRIRIY